jgi:hypothetical protein
MTTHGAGFDAATDDLVLEPPAPVPSVSHAQAASAMRIDEATAGRISTAVNAYVESLTSLEAQSPEFEQKVASISRMGHEEIRRAAEASNRFLDRPTVALRQGPMTQGSAVSGALLSLRQQIEELDPSRHLGQRRSAIRSACTSENTSRHRPRSKRLSTACTGARTSFCATTRPSNRRRAASGR